jgi:hypothetical protein
MEYLCHKCRLPIYTVDLYDQKVRKSKVDGGMYMSTAHVENAKKKNERLNFQRKTTLEELDEWLAEGMDDDESHREDKRKRE